MRVCKRHVLVVGGEETSYSHRVLVMRRGRGRGRGRGAGQPTGAALLAEYSGGEEKLRWAPQDGGAPWCGARQLLLACRRIGIPPYILPSTLSAESSSSFSVECGSGGYAANTHACQQEICTFHFSLLKQGTFNCLRPRTASVVTSASSQ